MSKALTQSKTVKFNVIMAGIEALHGSLALLSPMFTPDTFAIITVAIGMIHGMGGVYLRTITTQALTDK